MNEGRIIVVILFFLINKNLKNWFLSRKFAPILFQYVASRRARDLFARPIFLTPSYSKQ